MFALCVGGSVLATDRSIGRNPPPIHLQEVNCVGTEGDINECPRGDALRDCLDPGAGVICLNGNCSINCSNLPMDLVTVMFQKSLVVE